MEDKYKWNHGDRVEVLKVWAYDTPPEWRKGYLFERVDDSDNTTLVRSIESGRVTRWHHDCVRKER